MDSDPVLLGVNRSDLQNFPSTQFFAFEQGIEFWKAAQDLIHPDIEVRRSGFEQITALGAASQSPLLAYLLVSRLAEPDLPLRARIVQQISRLLNLPFNSKQAANEVLYFLKTNLSQLDRNQIVSLLDLAESDADTYSHVCKIISQCSHAGDHLTEIVADRQSPGPIRRLAVCLIGDIGYLCAISTLKRIKKRIESRCRSSVMGIARLNGDTALLPDIREALKKLKT